VCVCADPAFGRSIYGTGAGGCARALSNLICRCMQVTGLLAGRVLSLSRAFLGFFPSRARQDCAVSLLLLLFTGKYLLGIASRFTKRVVTGSAYQFWIYVIALDISLSCLTFSLRTPTLPRVGTNKAKHHHTMRVDRSPYLSAFDTVRQKQLRQTGLGKHRILYMQGTYSTLQCSAVLSK